MEQEDKKRKRSDLSSVSENDISFNMDAKKIEDDEIKAKYTIQTTKEKRKDKKKKKRLNTDSTDGDTEDTLDDPLDSIEKRTSANEIIMKSIHTELKSINSKMESMTTKKEMEKMFKTMFDKSLADMESRIKESVYKSVSHRIDIVEGELHTTNSENDKLKKDIESMKKEIKENGNEIQRLHEKHDKARNHYIRKTNELEQYTRRNSIRLTGKGITIEEEKETAAKTTETAVKLLNEKLGMNITNKDIDIAHRIGVMRRGTPRGIIVKFLSRHSKIASLKDKRTKLKGTGIYVQEDLTQLNANVLKHVRENSEIETAWSFEGQLYGKYKSNGNVNKVEYEEYEHWLPRR